MKRHKEKNKLFSNSQLILFILLFMVLILTGLLQVFQPKKITYKSKAEEQTVNLSFDPSSVIVNANQDFTVKIKASPQETHLIQLFRIVLNFDKEKVKIKDGGIKYKIGQLSLNLGADKDINLVNSKGQIIIISEIINPASGYVLSGNPELIELTFTALNNTSSAISVDTSKSFLKEVKSDYTFKTVNLSITNFMINPGFGPTATVTPSYSCESSPTVDCNGYCPSGKTCTTFFPGGQRLGCRCEDITPTPTNSSSSPSRASLDLKLKFQGVIKKPRFDLNKFEVKVTIKNKDLSINKSQIGGFITMDGITWQDGIIPFNIPPGSGYNIFIKGPKHLQKKVCTANPQESTPGSYPGADGCLQNTITLKEGTNVLDFSNIYLLVGDLPAQDGVVNSYDTSLVINNLGKTDINSLKVADINLDGIVNAQDYSLIISALSVRADEQ